jgi:hypothetical protein
VRSQDREHEVLVTDHNCGCHTYSWRSPTGYRECDIDEMWDTEEDWAASTCRYRPLSYVRWYDGRPSWWVRMTATGPDRAKRRRKTTEAVRMARAGEDMWTFDYGVMEGRVPYYW